MIILNDRYDLFDYINNSNDRIINNKIFKYIIEYKLYYNLINNKIYIDLNDFDDNNINKFIFFINNIEKNIFNDKL